MLMPRQKTPDLSVDTVAHGRFDLATDGAERFTLIVVYRGLHCPICATYLGELEALAGEFEERGVKTVALCSDDRDRTAQMADKIGAEDLRFGYGLPLDVAREWGLYISTGRGRTSIGIEEPDLFPEPGMFLVRPDRTLYFASVQTMPFVRPPIKGLLGAIDFAVEKDYPARGEYDGAV